MLSRTVALITIALAGQTGCTMLSSSVAAVDPANSSAQTIPTQQITQRLGPGEDPCRSLDQLQPGNFCKLHTSFGNSSATESTMSATASVRPSAAEQGGVIAGRIVSIDNANLVLADAISISHQPPARVASPATASRWGDFPYGPFAPRLFKVSGVGRTTIAIPGHVTIPRDAIRRADPLDGADWDRVQHAGQWFERVGIDFTFDALEGEPSSPS